jgi:hypothetical protein
MERDDIVRRYRRDRAIAVKIQTEALEHIAQPTLLKQAKRLGLSHGKTLVLNSEDELTLVFDLLMYTTARGLRSRAIDRYARVHVPPSGSDEERVLTALQASRFSRFRVEERHAAAGLMIRDLLRSEEIWLMDESLEASATPGTVLGTRIAKPDVFAMTCGAMIPINREMLQMLARLIDEAGVEPTRLADDPRLAESLYRTAVEFNLTEYVSHR